MKRRKVKEDWDAGVLAVSTAYTHLMLTHPAAMLASTDGTKYGLTLRSFSSACHLRPYVRLTLPQRGSKVKKLTCVHSTSQRMHAKG